MSAPCERIERFADGELAPEEAESFRQHLLDCDRCKAELGNLLQLKMMASRYAERQPAAALPPPSRWSFSRWSVAAAVGAACAALLAVGVFLQPRSSRTDPWLMSEPERRLEVRLAIAAADHHRPLSARKMGQAPPRAARLPLEALTELERNGDAAGLAAALLIKGIPAEALQHLERALDQAPTLPRALWNKALALRDLDLQEAAAAAFREVAALGEPGWAEEARQRAEALSAAEQARSQRWRAIASAGKALAMNGTLPSPDILAERPPILRLYSYDAVRTRTSPEQVRALLPLARELDQQAGGGDVLARYIERIATRDFTRQAPLVLRIITFY